MKQLYHRIMYFIELWGTPDPWMDGATIGASFAWALAGVKAEYHDELSHWEEV